MEALNTCKFDPSFRDEIVEKFVTDKDKFDIYNCLTCGVCTGGCPHSDDELGHLDPRKFVRQCLMGLKEEVLNDNFIWKCTMCGRCTMLCPMGVDVAGMVRTLRGNFGLTSPGHLQQIVDAQIETGNQMSITKEDYIETLEWMEEELQDEMDDPNVKIPVDEEGAEFLFLWGPREIKYYTDDIMSIAKIINAAGASWTCSSKVYDATQYGLFSGDDEASRVLVQRVADEVKRLKVKYVVVTECGHATRAYKWGPKVWLKPEDQFTVYNFMEMQYKWLKEGTIKVDKSINTELCTYHDPCNTARKEGIIEEPRYIISQAVENFKEMWPNREYNYCCGGGGGLLAFGKDYKDIRLEKGHLKAEQIKNTGAKICITPCHNCFDQLTEIVKHYKLDVKIKHMHHMVSEALILDKE